MQHLRVQHHAWHVLVSTEIYGETLQTFSKRKQIEFLEALSQTVAQSLARFKCPRKLVVVDALPRNTMGKVQKNLLRETFADLFKG